MQRKHYRISYECPASVRVKENVIILAESGEEAITRFFEARSEYKLGRIVVLPDAAKLQQEIAELKARLKAKSKPGPKKKKKT